MTRPEGLLLHLALVAALVLLWRFKIPEPILIVGAGLIGFAIFWLRGAV